MREGKPMSDDDHDRIERLVFIILIFIFGSIAVVGGALVEFLWVFK